ncbi:hypothetical protein [Rhodococcus ruber]|uniref:hypothetical protein n=1 Tax=Rhodococcus ruber TaxID=1830 RepID=UPI00265FE9A9|nr:hypothetical protein [Rhodococcus ruber]MDO1478514.1 hypothetical protein [Rhodococcus ruber]
MSSPGQTLTVWAGSWLAGHAAPDDVLDALHAWAPLHLVVSHDEPAGDVSGVPARSPVDGAAVLLTALRRADPAGADGIRLVLPAPGDVRGLPPGTALARAAVAAGEAVLAGAPGTPGLGFVPSVEGPDVLRWTLFAVPAVPEPPAEPGLGEAEFAMREAVREAATRVGRVLTVGAGGRAADPREQIAAEIAEHARHRYPESMPERAARILDSADQVAAILTVAGRGAEPDAASATGQAAREQALRPLWAAVRAARLGAVAATVRASHHA